MSTLDETALEKLNKKELVAMVVALQKTAVQMDKNIAILSEEVRMMRTGHFGRSSEKGLVDPDGEYAQMSFSFNEAEGTVDIFPDSGEPDMEEVVPKPYKRQKKKQGRREEEFAGIEATVVEHALSEEELIARFPSGKWERLPDKVYKRLEFHPASFEVVEHHVAVYAGGRDGGAVTAERPGDLFRNSIATPSLMAGILNYKYVNSQPINRIAQEFERNGVCIPRQNLCRWTIMCADMYLSRLYARLKRDLPKYHVVHADETPVEVRKDGRKAGSKSYMWVYRSGALEPNPFVLYEYQKTRKSDYPREFLKGFKGYCVTDGYEAYHSIDRERDDLTIAGCWAHARRGFADVVKSLPENARKDTVAYGALKLIKFMCDKERQLSGLPPDERLEKRKSDMAPLVDAFFAYINARSAEVPSQSGTGKAITYCQNQEKYLRVFLTDGYVPMENNAAERGIRTFCLGKKNWYLIDTVSGAQASAILYSIAETAKANDLKPYEYFKYLLEEIPRHGEYEDDAYLDALLPWSDQLPAECHKTPASEDAAATGTDDSESSASEDDAATDADDSDTSESGENVTTANGPEN